MFFYIKDFNFLLEKDIRSNKLPALESNHSLSARASIMNPVEKKQITSDAWSCVARNLMPDYILF